MKKEEYNIIYNKLMDCLEALVYSKDITQMLLDSNDLINIMIEMIEEDSNGTDSN